MATPVNSIMTTFVFPPLVEILYTSNIDKKEPMKAEIPTNENCTASGRYCLKCPPKTMAMAASSVAPDVSPIKSPVARGFLNNPCNPVPETASILPMRIAMIILAALTSQTTYLSLNDKPGSPLITFPNTSNADLPPKS